MSRILMGEADSVMGENGRDVKRKYAETRNNIHGIYNE